MEFDMYLGFMRYGSTWRRQRRALHQQLNPSAIGNYHHILSLELVQLIKGLESTPQKFESHIKR
jgi:cytochrome P450